MSGLLAEVKSSGNVMISFPNFGTVRGGWGGGGAGGGATLNHAIWRKLRFLFDFLLLLLKRGEGFFVRNREEGPKYQGKETVGMGSNRYGDFSPKGRNIHIKYKVCMYV